MYMVQLFTFSHQMPGKRIIVGTEPIHLEVSNTANERISIARYCYRMTARVIMIKHKDDRVKLKIFILKKREIPNIRLLFCYIANFA